MSRKAWRCAAPGSWISSKVGGLHVEETGNTGPFLHVIGMLTRELTRGGDLIGSSQLDVCPYAVALHQDSDEGYGELWGS
jgi:hypothetical protein